MAEGGYTPNESTTSDVPPPPSHPVAVVGGEVHFCYKGWTCSGDEPRSRWRRGLARSDWREVSKRAAGAVEQVEGVDTNFF